MPPLLLCIETLTHPMRLSHFFCLFYQPHHHHSAILPPKAPAAPLTACLFMEKVTLSSEPQPNIGATPELLDINENILDPSHTPLSAPLYIHIYHSAHIISFHSNVRQCRTLHTAW